ncbi:MAG: hypothetical protein IKY18_02890 [Oscillospiraceae bacterium]|nr:hypothetical protein [Oscillospiraceae bacterium]
MKKLFSALSCLLLALIAFCPVISLICTAFGYKFTLVNPSVFAIAIFVLTAITVLVSIFYKEVLENKVICTVVSALTPMALINTGFYVRSCGILWILASVLICVGCGYLTIRHGSPLNVRTGALVLSAGLLLPMALICFVLSVAGKTQNYNILDTVDSPTGAYYAEIIDNNQGEKGGTKMVHIYPEKDIDTDVFQIRKKRIIIYEEFYKANEADKVEVVVQWKDDNHLVINGKNYSF